MLLSNKNTYYFCPTAYAMFDRIVSYNFSSLPFVYNIVSLQGEDVEMQQVLCAILLKEMLSCSDRRAQASLQNVGSVHS